MKIPKSDLRELRNFIRQTQPILSLTPATLQHHLGRFLLFQAAIGLAIEERTGHPPPDGGCDYTEADRRRAEEIILLYPTESA